MVAFMATVGRFQEESLASLWQYHLEIPPEIAQPFLGGDRRVICTLPNGEVVHCALMPRGDNRWYIFLNKKLRAQLQANEGDLLSIELQKDESKYGLPVPEELQVLWDQDPEGFAIFESLSPGKQRTLIYWTGTVKNPDKRLTRALVMMNHVKTTKGNIDFKQMNAALKLANTP